MGIFLSIADRSNLPLIESLKTLLGDDVPIWDVHQIPEYDKVTMVVAWKHPYGSISKNQFPNLKIISSLGAGVEHLLEDKTIEKDVFLSRIVEPSLQSGMQQYAAWACFHILKNISIYHLQQSQQKWQVLNETIQPYIGIIGFGQLGKAIAQGLHSLGYKVAAYKNNPIKLKYPFPVFASTDLLLEKFVIDKQIILNVLPATKNTKNIFSKDIFDAMPSNSGFINIGRGNQVDEKELLDALDRGPIKHAILDVFQTEPLPVEHPFWSHPKVTVTPHVASITRPEKAAEVIATNYQRMMNNLPPQFMVNREKGY